MKIEFTTKAESKRKQQEEFLKLKPIERLRLFFKMMEESRKLPQMKKEKPNNNFIIELKSKK